MKRVVLYNFQVATFYEIVYILGNGGTFMIQKIEVLAADVDMTLSSKGSPLPEITIHALKELHERNVKIGLATGREITEMEKQKESFGI